MPGAALRLLCGVLLPAAVLRAEPLPRVAFAAGDPRRPLARFSLPNVSDYDALLLRGDEDELYVGARDRLLALAVGGPGPPLATASLPWAPTAEKASECAFKKKSQETECFNFIRVLVALNRTHLYVCGTYAFSPACAYVDLENFTLVASGRGQPFLDGKGQCPFDPQHTHTALLVDGELYAGTMNNFQGNEPIISRSLGGRPALKTDAFLRWLAADAAFVASFSAPGDDKVYFFFEETADEFDFFERLLVPRVARVCKGDVGGEKVLQKKWTTFLKAQLVCAQPGRFPFNVIQHAFALPRRAGRADFYAVFTAQWQAGGSAVCAYSQESVEQVFEGKYKELNKESSRWTVYGGPDMSPRPGSCSVGPSSDKALTFLKDHFLMDGKVLPGRGEPLLVRAGVKYTRIAVDEPRGLAGTAYRVLFLGTADGFLDKAVELPGAPHVVERIQLFPAPEPVKNLLLAPGKGLLYVGYSGGVLQIPLANCSGYRSCAECLLARDPYCAWDGHNRSCRPARLAGAHAGWLQDVETGQPAAACHRGRSGAAPRARGGPDGAAVETLSPPLHAVVRLPCPRRSALAAYAWQQPGEPPGAAAALLPDHTLLVLMRRGAAGAYRCQATENGYTWTVAHYLLREPAGAEEAPGRPAAGHHRSYWPQFVTVTVLLAVTLAAAACVAFGAYHEQLKARRKVRGCGAAPPPGRPEKEPLRAEAPPPPAAAPPARCLQLRDADADDGAERLPA
ncbi:semaphorin-4A isoform X2 [Dromaius novaehollandiae]|uniref:semaphorin-4A isoform X2 n=1 Tax=Dromaius novaehollandiae TaxID=8790 RepID=UPI00311DFA6B